MAKVPGGTETRLTQRDLNRAKETINRNRSDLPFTSGELTELQQQLRLLSHRQLFEPDRKTIRSAHEALRAYLSDDVNLNKLRAAVARFKKLRNRVAHGRAPSLAPEVVQRAYTLDDDDV